MELTHRFAVPTPVEETWAHFQDIASVAECFPGAQVTSVATDAGAESFTGTCKVKLGPIALVYTGSGSFVERDDVAHRFVVEAKGRDKRGNGTAGATVALSMSPSDAGTEVEVLTDLAVTGKPAQFGRGVMQDVSDKLLGQFVACLEERLVAGQGQQDAVPATPATPAAPSAPSATAAPAATALPATEPVTGDAGARAPSAGSARAGDDALDLGATVLPVLVRSYGKQVATVLVVVLGLWWVVRALRRR